MDNRAVATTTTAPRLPAMDAWRGKAALRWPLTADATAAFGLICASLLFYYPLVFLGRALVDYDAFVYFYPQRVFMARSLLAGKIPLWDPDLFSGAPFLANPQTAVLYPPSWLFLIGAPYTIYTVQLVLHAFLAAFFTYLLARHAFGAIPLAAAVGGLAYAFGGFAVGQEGHLNQVSAAAWLPAVLLAYHRFVVTRQPRWLGLGALALALQLLAGHPQETYMTLIVLGLFGLFTAPWSNLPKLVLSGAGGIVLCLLGGLLSAAQLLPTLELAPLSIRGAGVNWSDAVAGSLPSYLAVRALLPPYWIRVPYTEYLGYVGVTVVALALLALVGGRFRLVLFGAIVSAIGVFLALGENTDVYAWAFSVIPGFDTFRVPARWLLLWAFGASLLAAMGVDWIGRGSPIRARSPWFWLRAMALVAIVYIALKWQADNGEAFASRRSPALFAAIALATLAVAALSYLGRRGLAISILVVMASAELWAAADASPARQAPPPAFAEGQTVDWLRAHGATEQDRLLSMARPEYVPAAEGAVRTELSAFPSRTVDLVLAAQKWNDTLTPNVPMQYGLSTADGYDGGVLPLLRWLHLSGLVVQSPRPDGVLLTRLEAVPTDRILDLLGVRYVITNADATAGSVLQMVDFGDLRLFARPRQVPLSLVISGVMPVADEAAGLARMASADFDPNREVVIEDAGVSRVAPSDEGVGVTPDVVSAERWHASVSLAQPGYLLQREAWYPGWRARVDGADAPLFRADSVFRAVALSPGSHDVEIYFDSSSFKRGALLSGAGVVVIIVLFAWRLIIRTRVQSLRRAGSHTSAN